MCTVGSIDADRIARWDGASFAPVASSIDGDGVNPFIWALATFDGNLIAAGDFTSANGRSTNYIVDLGP